MACCRSVAVVDIMLYCPRVNEQKRVEQYIYIYIYIYIVILFVSHRCNSFTSVVR